MTPLNTNSTNINPSASPKLAPDAGLLPDLCSNTSLVGLIIAGELLALALTLVQTPLMYFSWEIFGYISLLVQWIILVSAWGLCHFSSYLSRFSTVVAGALAYGFMLFISVIVLSVAWWLIQGTWLEFLKSLLLAAIFIGLFLRYLYLQQQLRKQQQAELHARIQALHARIRPHFLFNAMNAVVSLIPVNPDLAEKVIEDLCALFRVSLQETALVTLDQEIDLCRHYVAIEQVRLGERLQVHWQCEHSTAQGHIQVPSLLLQPLLENAISHGIGRLPSGGTVQMQTHVQGDALTVVVTNPVPHASHHNRGTDNLPNMKNNHMALDNIRHRLQAHYGSGASIVTEQDAQPDSAETNSTETNTEHYYRVTLRLPIANEE